MKTKVISPIGDSWEDFEKEVFTQQEIAASNFRVSFIGEIINARKKEGMSQKQLETVSGVRQPVIARLEKGRTDPQLSTVIKLLAPLGKTLAIVPLDKKEALNKK